MILRHFWILFLEVMVGWMQLLLLEAVTVLLTMSLTNGGHDNTLLHMQIASILLVVALLLSCLFLCLVHKK